MELTKKPVQWTLISETGSPDTPVSKRRGFAITGAGSDRIIIFGGYNGSYLNDLWEYNYNNNTWTQLSPSLPPAVREKAVMVYDDNNKIILFGGDDNGSLPDLNDTWEYDISANTWTQLSPASPPTGRSSHGMSYTGNDKVLMAGGSTGSAELWEYDINLNTWTLITPNPDGTAFVGRYGHGMEYTGNGEIFIFGGNGGSLLNDMWKNDIDQNYKWFKVIKDGVSGSPSARQDSRMVYTANGYIALFGGDDGDYLNDTWLFDTGINKWSQIINELQPERRSLHGMVYIGKNELLLFGGYYYDGTHNYLNDVWKFYAGP